MDNAMFKTLFPRCFVYDLEYIGIPNKLEACFIWQIGIVHLQSNQRFTITIDPGIRPLPPPMSGEFMQVTELFLMQSNAVSFERGWEMCCKWMNLVGEGNKLLISHNNFKSDKLMLEIECKRRSLHLPYNWYFFDSLLFCRKAIPKQTSYTLKDLYRSFKGSDIPNNHSALPDAIALVELLGAIGYQNICGPIYGSHSTSLQIVKWLGPACEKTLFSKGINSLEQLIANILTKYSIVNLGAHLDLNTFVHHYISTTCGILTRNSKSISESIVSRWLPTAVK